MWDLLYTKGFLPVVFVRDAASAAREFFYNIKRIIEWIPILWNDRDWDYGYLLLILEFKLKRMRLNITRGGIGQNATRTGKQIAYAEFLIRRLREDNYLQEEMKQHEAKWGPFCRRKKWTDGTSVGNAFHIRQNATTLQKWQLQMVEERALYQKQASTKEDDKRRLFRHLHLYIERWWD
jgi:hypothetical protein